MSTNALNAQIYEEATEWIILHRSGDLDAETKRRFDAWLRASPQHLRAYLEMSTIWEDVPALNRDWNPSADELIALARAEGNVVPLAVEKAPTSSVPASQGPEPQHRREARSMQLLALAATLVVVLGAAAWFRVFHNVYTTGTGEQRTLVLNDGSTVELNAQSKIRVAYTDAERTIQLLRGQALFKVAKDPSRPFVVATDGTIVRAVGTQFDVYKKPAGTQVTVIEGRVAVVHAKAPAADVSVISGPLETQLGEVLVSAGEKVLIAQGPVPELAAPADGITAAHDATDATVTAANIEAVTAWTRQRLVFDFTPLMEVAHEFNRYNRRPMKVECGAAVTPAPADDLCSFNISGSFSSADPRLLLRFLREQPGIVVNETPDEIRISREDSHG